MAVGVLIVISGLALWKPVQFSELAALFGSFQATRVVHFLCMAAIVGFLLVHMSLALLVPQSLVAMVTGGPVVDDGAAHPTERGGRSRSHPLTRGLDVHSHAHAIHFPPAQRHRSGRADAEPGARRRHQSPQRAARRHQPRRAVAVDRLRRQRRRFGAKSAARGVGVERSRAGDDLPAAPSGADLQRRRRSSSRRASTPITTSKTSSRSTARPGNSNSPAASTTNSLGPRSRSISCPSRRSSSSTSASKAGITSGNGPARTCAISCNASAPI